MHNFTEPFFLSAKNIRGRFAECSTLLNEIFERRSYPAVIENLIAEAVTLTALLASTLKFDGFFTFQAKGDGPLSLLVVESNHDGKMRACATYDDAAFQDLLTRHENPNLLNLMGKGFLAFTVHHGLSTDNYQGIVEIDAQTLTSCVHHYFTQSEQMTAYLHIAAHKHEGKWLARGMMLQQLPYEENKTTLSKDDFDDAWREVVIYMGSLKNDEFLNAALTSNDLLRRLFHEFDTMLYQKHALAFECRCSEARAKSIIELMPDDERENEHDKGTATVTCEFCGQHYMFRLDELEPFKK